MRQTEQVTDPAPLAGHVAPVNPPAMLGVLGGGQFGRFFVLAARQMGYQVTVLDPDPLSPAGALANTHLIAEFDDTTALQTLASTCAAVTVDFENPPVESLKFLADHTVVRPSPEAIAICQDRILEKAFLQKNQNRVPAQYRRYMQGLAEVRVSPSIFIPDALIISPKLFHTGLYGVTWRPLSLGVPLGSGAAQLHLSAGLVATSFFLHSDTLPTTLFLRPGADLTAEAILMPTKTFGFSFGWQSAFYVPQALGTFFQVQPFSQDVWHLGQAFLKLHVRFPYTL